MNSSLEGMTFRMDDGVRDFGSRGISIKPNSKKARTKGDEPPAAESVQLLFSQHLANQKLYGSKEGAIYKWSNSHWQLIEHQEMERIAHKWVAENQPGKASEKTAKSCVATAILHLDVLPEARAQTIPMQDCTIEIVGNKVVRRQSSREDGLTYVLTCNYEPSASRDMFDAFLREALPVDDVRNFLEEYAGYTLLGDTRHQLAAWLIGEGGTGKGTFAQIMQAMHRQTVALSLDGLDGFKLAGLRAASLVCVDETPQRIDEQRLKTLISGDMVQIDIKYHDPINLRPTAKWIVNGNALPAISDHSTGFWRRWLIFPFNVVPRQKTPLLSESIINTELPGVFMWCLSGLIRLLDRGKFPPLPEEMEDAARRGKQQSNSVSAWIVDAGIHETDDIRNSRKDVYASYSHWCYESGTKAVASQKFWERIKQSFPEIKCERRLSCGERLFRVNLHIPPEA